MCGPQVGNYCFKLNRKSARTADFTRIYCKLGAVNDDGNAVAALCRVNMSHMAYFMNELALI